MPGGKKSMIYQDFLGEGFPQNHHSLYSFQPASPLYTVSWNPAEQRKQKGLKLRDTERDLNSLGGILQKESDCCPSFWSSFLLPSLAESSRVWTSAKGQRAFLAKRSHCGHDGPKQEGSILCGNRAYQMSEPVPAGCNLILQAFLSTCFVPGILTVLRQSHPSMNSRTGREVIHSVHSFIHSFNFSLLRPQNLVIENTELK